MSKGANRKQSLCAPMYAVLYAELRMIAKGHGYALTIHGSLKRDLDLVAIPWVDDASEPDKLAFAIQEFIGCKSIGAGDSREIRPHGRRTYVFHLDEYVEDMRPGLYGNGPYIDLSVMPILPRNFPTENI